MRDAVAAQLLDHEQAGQRGDATAPPQAARQPDLHAPSLPSWHTVVCIASGPSLTADDCNAVRIWREAYAGRGVIVVNTSFRIAPWADILYAADREWWNEYGQEARTTFTGELWSPHADFPGVRQAESEHQANSGAGALVLATHLGAKRVILLGYDCQKTDGRAHWHPDHPNGLDNVHPITWWPMQFAKLKHELPEVQIVNATRQTALTCFDRHELHAALADIRHPASLEFADAVDGLFHEI